ncbi:MAG TPA: polysaccharide deacetylase family protein, partial [Candidatus Ozemobacteraceae bacterium]|nr:polysaccharide deacetylase family protein [Candidatus Ozemobacteraceae bacterium]
LTFHGVTETPSRPWEIRWLDLIDSIKNLSQYDFKPIAPGSFSAWLDGSIKGGRRFFITFDDGLETSGEAIRRLKKDLNLSSALFVTTDMIGQPGYLSYGALRELASETGCLIGLHGLRHLEPTKIIHTGGNFIVETVSAKQQLEKELGKDIQWYAYPFGDFDAEARNQVASAGLTYGFTIEGDDIRRETDPLLFPRVMYLKGVEKAGGPSISDWTPPKNASAGGLSITLALFVGMMGLRSVLRCLMLRRALANANAAA